MFMGHYWDQLGGLEYEILEKPVTYAVGILWVQDFLVVERWVASIIKI